jgi:hypothetical protein
MSADEAASARAERQPPRTMRLRPRAQRLSCGRSDNARRRSGSVPGRAATSANDAASPAATAIFRRPVRQRLQTKRPRSERERQPPRTMWLRPRTQQVFCEGSGNVRRRRGFGPGGAATFANDGASPADAAVFLWTERQRRETKWLRPGRKRQPPRTMRLHLRTQRVFCGRSGTVRRRRGFSPGGVDNLLGRRGSIRGRSDFSATGAPTSRDDVASSREERQPSRTMRLRPRTQQVFCRRSANVRRRSGSCLGRIDKLRRRSGFVRGRSDFSADGAPTSGGEAAPSREERQTPQPMRLRPRAQRAFCGRSGNVQRRSGFVPGGVGNLCGRCGFRPRTQ